MKLKTLQIKKYKNLKDVTIDFESGNGLTILVGNNGTGKSNVLEAISGIFHDLYKEKSDRKLACDYTLKYMLDGINCKIEQKNGTLRCYGERFKSRVAFISQNSPNNIIGLYSGEEDRLWTTFYESYYKAYIRKIKTFRHQERMRLMFVNKYYWNVALLTLLLSDNDTLSPFIREDLGINDITKVVLKFNFHYFDAVNDLLKTFIDRINPEHKNKMEYSLEDLRNNIFFDVLADEKGNKIVDENGDQLLTETGITDSEVFRNLTQAYMPKKEKILKDISIFLNEGITVQQLSEGEKKLILVKTVLEILSDEKTLILMDEPDAHLHEERKPSLINLLRNYPNRQIVIVTHSPIIAQQAYEPELIMLEVADGKASLMSNQKREKIKRLTGSAWDIIGKEMMLKSDKPLVVFEGKTDVMYVKRALELLKTNTPRFNTFSVDFLNANGAGNVKSFIDNLKEFVSASKKIIVFFDRDNAGRDGAHAITGISKSDERIMTYQDIVQDNITVSFIPYKVEVTDGDFLIEDYFSWDGTIKEIVEDLIPDRKHPIKNLPNLPERIKSEIAKRVNGFESDEFNGFIPLLDKILQLSQDVYE